MLRYESEFLATKCIIRMSPYSPIDAKGGRHKNPTALKEAHEAGKEPAKG
jgi:hypothetical protein